MASQQPPLPPPPQQQPDDEFFDHLFSISSYSAVAAADSAALAAAAASLGFPPRLGAGELDGGSALSFPLALSLDQDNSSGGKRLCDNPDRKPSQESDPLQLSGLFAPGYTQVHQAHQVRPSPSPCPPGFHSQPKHGGTSAGPQPPAPRPKVRARRGQATDPHSIAERQRRERIAERIRTLQELVPHTNKTDRAVMLDEILDYVKFLKLQVKVLNMSRLGGAGAVAQLVADIPLSVQTSESGSKQHVWEKWSTDGTERQVAKLMEENVGEAMQFLQSKALCIMPISLAMAIYDSHPDVEGHCVKPELNTSPV